MSKPGAPDENPNAIRAMMPSTLRHRKKPNLVADVCWPPRCEENRGAQRESMQIEYGTTPAHLETVNEICAGMCKTTLRTTWSHIYRSFAARVAILFRRRLLTLHTCLWTGNTVKVQRGAASTSDASMPANPRCRTPTSRSKDACVAVRVGPGRMARRERHMTRASRTPNRTKSRVRSQRRPNAAPKCSSTRTPRGLGRRNGGATPSPVTTASIRQRGLADAPPY